MTESHATETRAKGTTTAVRFRRSALRACAALALGLTLLACSSIEVRSEFDPSRVPESATTFAWLPTASARVDESLEAPLRAAIERELGALGLELVPYREASFAVDYQLSIKTEMRANARYFEFYAAEEYERGTLVIDLVDAKTLARFWHGSASSELRLSAVLLGPFAKELTPTDDPREWRIEEKVAAILEGLPPSLAGADG